MNKESLPYRGLCTEYYELDKPSAPDDALNCYLKYAEEAKGLILEPMCGTGRFLIPLLEKGYSVTGFDYSPYMLDICRKKCTERGLTADLQEATFKTFVSPELYNLIFIPSGSFGHLISSHEITQALTFITDSLASGGKFVFEVETLTAVREPQGIWKGRWINKSDGSKIVMSILSQFDAATCVETGLFRYELWEGNAISQIEVEDYQVRHYTPAEIEELLDRHGLKVIGKWQAEPFAQIAARDNAAVILYECIKD
ncbi:MAG TPA: class I SAM-dependent methyltransferase [Parachlamydiaceae bacterium]|nr:class I SAM-dependent methyltransferase [Parachlamydiaceae bacterium]